MISDDRFEQIQITANGVDFTALQIGEGPLALCLHGFPDTAWTYRFLLPELAEAGFRAVAPFMRGYAPTALPVEPIYQAGVLGQDACELHEALGGDENAVIVGHDWGALATYSAAVVEPRRFRRVVAASVPPGPELASAFFSYPQLKRSWYMFFILHDLADLAVSAPDIGFIEGLWKDWSPGYDGRQDASAVRDALATPENLTAALSYYRHMLLAENQRPELAIWQQATSALPPQPTLYLHGRDDGCMGVDLIKHPRAHLPNEASRFEIIDNAGHFLQLEQPEHFNRLVVDFLTA